MRSEYKIFIQFQAKLDKPWQHNLQSFRDAYKHLIGPKASANGLSEAKRKELYRKVDSAIAFMEDYGYNFFVLHLEQYEYDTFMKLSPDLYKRFKSLRLSQVSGFSDWRYARALQVFYDCVFHRIINSQYLSQSKFNRLKCEANEEIYKIICSQKIKYNKRIYKKMSSNYYIISRWCRRGML